MQWYIWAFIGMICLTAVTLLLKKVTQLEPSTVLINLYIFGFTFLGFIIWTASKKEKLLLSKSVLILLIIISAIAILLNFALVESYRLAPNPGYARAIVTISTALVAIFALFTLGAKISIAKIAGVVLIVIGTIALLL